MSEKKGEGSSTKGREKASDKGKSPEVRNKFDTKSKTKEL